MQNCFRFTSLSIVFLIIVISSTFSNHASAIIIEPELQHNRLGEITDAAHPGDGTDRMFLLRRSGSIIIWDKETNTILDDEPFLDISDKVMGGGERGLLGIGFHPNYADNGKFYVHYSTSSSISGVDHLSVIAEFTTSADDPNLADPESEREILVVEQPERNHNAGQLKFGHDGMLYIAMGDGGGSGDQHGQIGNGQDLTTLLGSMLRINVDQGDPYTIPDDNPFVDDPEARDEIWAYGLRNPWRFSFDRATGVLFAGDVGQNRIEEISILENGGNYGWRIMEGSDCYNPSNCDPTGLILPIAEYSRNTGLGYSITGGYVYRGNRYPSLEGKYIFGDLGGTLMYLEQDDTDDWSLNEFTIESTSSNSINRNIYSFAEDRDGEMYIITGDGSIYLITVPGESGINRWTEFD